MKTVNEIVKEFIDCGNKYKGLELTISNFAFCLSAGKNHKAVALKLIKIGFLKPTGKRNYKNELLYKI